MIKSGYKLFCTKYRRNSIVQKLFSVCITRSNFVSIFCCHKDLFVKNLQKDKSILDMTWNQNICKFASRKEFMNVKGYFIIKATYIFILNVNSVRRYEKIHSKVIMMILFYFHVSMNKYLGYWTIQYHFR